MTKTKKKKPTLVTVEFTEGVVLRDGEEIGTVSQQFMGWKWHTEEGKESRDYYLDAHSAAEGLARSLGKL